MDIEYRVVMPAILDDVTAMIGIDVSNMLGQIASMPQQLSSSLRSRINIEPGVERLCFCGLGGSAMGADILCDHLEMTSEVFGAVTRDYRLPRWVDEETLTLLVSYSGNTRETLSMYEEARRRNSRIAAITSGGKLLQLCVENKEAHIRVPAGLHPRAALGHLLGAAASIVETAGIVPAASHLDEVVPVLREDVIAYSPQVPSSDNKAKQIAKELKGSMPFVYSSRDIRTAGRRWQTQINENSKMLALYGELPESDHNQIVGWVDGPRNDIARPVFLRASSDQGMMADIVEATVSIYEDFGLRPLAVEIEGATTLECIMRGIVLGDHVSYYLAMLNGVDPTPISSIFELKKRLG